MLEVWAGPQLDGSVVAVLFNMNGAPANITAPFSSLSLPVNTIHVRDLWAHQDLGVFQDTFTAEVESHGAVMVRLTPAQTQRSIISLQ
jgi:alpha-galactosidase